MRRFIRHPSTVPLRVTAQETGSQIPAAALVNLSCGGLCFSSPIKLARGQSVGLCIGLADEVFEYSARVIWCCAEAEDYFVGVGFMDEATEYSVRMVEQACHVEHYRLNQRDFEGRHLSREQAASEWVARYAADFPVH